MRPKNTLLLSVAVVVCLTTWTLGHITEQYVKNRRKVVDYIMTNRGVFLSPTFLTGNATEVYVHIDLISIDCIDQTTMEFTLTLVLTLSWHDPRITYPANDSLSRGYGLELGPKLIEKVWVPDIYFVNSKKASLHDITMPNKMLRVYPNGTMVYSVRVTMLSLCAMQLQKFPLDTQMCHISMESVSSSAKLLVLKWDVIPIKVRPDMMVPQFKLESIQNVDCTKYYDGIGVHSCLRNEYYVSRCYSYYITQVYIPSGLVVVLSWGSFWLDTEATPARITVGLLTVLTLTTQSTASRIHLPRVSYIKAIDVWMGVCLLFVFGALVEFAYVNVHARQEYIKKVSDQVCKSTVGETVIYTANLNLDNEQSQMQLLKAIDLDHEFSDDVDRDQDEYPESDLDCFVPDDKNGDDDNDNKNNNNNNNALNDGNSQRRKVDVVDEAKGMQSKRTIVLNENGGSLSIIGFKTVDPLGMAVSESHISNDSDGQGKSDYSMARKIDEFARVIFPTIFLLFNISYWTFYMSWKQEIVLGAAT